MSLLIAEIVVPDSYASVQALSKDLPGACLNYMPGCSAREEIRSIALLAP